MPVVVWILLRLMRFRRGMLCQFLQREAYSFFQLRIVTLADLLGFHIHFVVRLHPTVLNIPLPLRIEKSKAG
jgi:hypothetical protein